ncbi:P-loop containing nucleoside triphosphate hydrolase protein [Chaetomium fimeti]|uniref:P-loop containing nucleoside triphosphate hydrolase protein n=1 Tax=Chaetomium fimeti TaxID=1854472 RepID=A0AAE0LQU7_9PEZI|nr:P-loop containing nucleoside triphosphate hydrolase protein [Chaetomium fimeti]
MDRTGQSPRDKHVEVMRHQTGCPKPRAVTLLIKHAGNIRGACDEFLGNIKWDFSLPRIPAPQSLTSHIPQSRRLEPDTWDGQLSHHRDAQLCHHWDTPANGDDDTGFHVRHLIGAIQNGETCRVVRTYLTHFAEALGLEAIKNGLNGVVDGYPAVFFVVETGNADMVKVWISYAGTADHTYCKVPLLGFAIALCDSYRTDMPMVVKTLLSSGYPADVIPRAFYSPLQRDLPHDGPPETELQDFHKGKTAWCVPNIRVRLAKALNLSFTVRYDLDLASRDQPPSGANKKLAQVHKASELLLLDRFLAHLSMPTSRPLVLLFAGPSGHGKTEVARNLGWLLGMDLQTVDCTHLKAETDLFGPWPPFEGWDEDSAVNNYLVSHSGKRCVVFMDEFEKTKDEVRRALLLPFESGEYRDRRVRAGDNSANCSKTIWILATNAFDQTIQSFCYSHQDDLFKDAGTKQHEEKVHKLARQLSGRIQKESITVLGAPLTGRISGFIPFLPFSPLERAAVADKHLADFGRQLARPINTSEEPARYCPVGNVHLQIKRGYTVNKALVERGYVKELGARSIINAIDSEIRMPLIGKYLAAREEVREDQPAVGFLVGVDGETGDVEVSECEVGE